MQLKTTTSETLFQYLAKPWLGKAGFCSFVVIHGFKVGEADAS